MRSHHAETQTGPTSLSNSTDITRMVAAASNNGLIFYNDLVGYMSVYEQENGEFARRF
jgi:hypothetical protein